MSSKTDSDPVPTGHDHKESTTDNKSPFLYFYTRTCRYCERMGENVQQLNQKLIESNAKPVQMFDLQADPKHMAAYERYASTPQRCLGVPFLYNVETEDFICGFTGYDNLKNFAKV